MEVRFHSILKHYAPQGSAGVMMVHMPESVTAEELLKELNVNLLEVQDITVNSLPSELGRILSDGDRIGVFPHSEEASS